jgi:hypothetical protein
MNLQLISTTAQAVIALAALIASVCIPLALERRSKRQARAQYQKSIHDMWMHFDEVALTSTEYLKLADSILEPHNGHLTDGERVKRWLGYMIWNMVHCSFMAIEHGLSLRSNDVERQDLEARIRGLCRDPMMLQILNESYGRSGMWTWAQSFLGTESQNTESLPSPRTGYGRDQSELEYTPGRTNF